MLRSFRTKHVWVNFLQCRPDGPCISSVWCFNVSWKFIFKIPTMVISSVLNVKWVVLGKFHDKCLHNIQAMKWLVSKHFHVKYFFDVHVWMGYLVSRVDGPAKFSYHDLISESSSREVFSKSFLNYFKIVPKWSSTREDLYSKLSSNISIIIQRWSLPEWLIATTNTQ